MRLTLRTMLAYLDNLLTPSDAKELASKIEESEFATALTHRIRDVTRRLRLAAPRVEGRGMGLDPNTVAEYLDNTLPAERAPDFEKVCLESDVHLAEVASAHQILTLVLGEPAEVDPNCRQRMYRLIAQPAAVSAERSAAPEINVRRSDSPDSGRRRRQKGARQVPDYLREPSRSKRRVQVIVAAVLVAVLIGAAVILFQNSGEPTSVAEKEAQRSSAAPAESLESLPGESETSPPGEQAVEPGGAPETAPPATDEAPPSPIEDAAPPAPIEPTPETTSDAAESRAPLELPDVNPATEPVPSSAPTVEPGASAEPPRAPSPDDVAISLPDVTNRVFEPEVSPTATPPAPPEPNVPAETTTAHASIGRLISQRDVVVRYETAPDAWQRLPGSAAGGTLYGGDRLRTMPTYHADLSMTEDVTIHMLGGTHLELIDSDGVQPAGLRITQGRVIMLALGRPDSKLRLAVEGRSGVMEFGSADATAAVEVRRILEEGSDPEKVAATVVADVYVTSGEIRWLSDRGGEPLVVKAPVRWPLDDEAVPPAAKPDATVEFPEWITSEEITPIEKRASETIEAELSPERSLTLTLKELVDDRRVEVRSLAARCLATVDEFEPDVRLLGDAKLRASWPETIESLRFGMARDAATAAKVRQTIEELRGPNAAALYRMLWGYTDSQLQAGEAGQLVRNLDHDDLDFRVVAFWNLRRISGFGAGAYYQPQDTAAKRQPYVQKWKQRLDEGLITRAAGAE